MIFLPGIGIYLVCLLLGCGVDRHQYNILIESLIYISNLANRFGEYKNE